MAEGENFEIYQSDSGYVAVTNPVRRQILDALSKQPLELPDLMKITGKAKPTLSNIHMRELIGQNLVEELPHPTDQRKKVFRLKATRIGSSNVPIDQLRGAVKHYVSLSPLAYAVPLASVLDVLVAHGAKSSKETLRMQGAKLGEVTAKLLTTSSLRDLLTSVATFWERENVARAGKIDLDHLEIEVTLAENLAQNKGTSESAATVLAAFLEGVASAKLGERPRASARLLAEGRISIGLAATP